MENTVDVTGLTPADVLAALYNAARPQGLGFMQYDPKPMERAEAAELLSKFTRFDYLKGRVMKIVIENPLSVWGYDRDNGPGAAQAAIDALRANNPAALQDTHRKGMQAAAREVKAALNTESGVSSVNGDMAVFTLGLSDVADPLNDAIDQALR